MSELIPGRLARLSPSVWRLIAPNPGLMTGPGTNTYYVGSADGVIVIDPGPADPRHTDAIVEQAPAPIVAIAVTHTHRDHSPGAAPLAQRCGAPVHGQPAPPTPENDAGFRADNVLRHGDVLSAPGAALRVVHTPGHASNHVCFLDEATGMLFTGDHLMGGSTVVIAPPDGDMSAYLGSLRALRELPIQFIAPGHGPVIDEPRRLIDWTIAHRLEREDKVVRALASNAPATLAGLVGSVYGDVDERLHPIAKYSLHAHLLKLERDGRAERCGDDWQPTARQ